MARGLTTTIKNLLAADTIRYFDLLELHFSSAAGGVRLLTNGAHDLELTSGTPTLSGSRTFLADGNWLGYSAPAETGAPLVNTSVVTLSGSDPADTYTDIFLNNAYVGTRVVIYRQFMEAEVSPPSLQGDPVMLWDGEMTSVKIMDTVNSSDIAITTTNVFYDFDLINCRRTNGASQAATKYYTQTATNKTFANDKGFEFATQDIQDLSWGKKV